MIWEEVLKPLAGPMGALGISSETCADLGKERRTATKTPPGEMLMAVANSKESLPLPSRVRIKTGMASCKRAHLRSSFFDNLRGTCLDHLISGIQTQDSAVGAKLRGGVEQGWNPSKPRQQHGDYRSAIPASGFNPEAGMPLR